MLFRSGRIAFILGSGEAFHEAFCNFWDLGVIVSVRIEAREEVKQRLIYAFSINVHVDPKASAKFVDQATLANIFVAHGILPAVKDGLSLAVRIACNDEYDADQLPLCQFNPRV